MKEIFKKGNLALINRWNNDYILFYIKDNNDYFPCMIKITPKDKENILKNHDIQPTLDLYKNKHIDWTPSYFISSSLIDYLAYQGLNLQQIESHMDYLTQNQIVARELYLTIVFEAFPEKSPVTSRGYSAQDLHLQYQLNVLDSYEYLIWLKDHKPDANHMKSVLINEILRDLNKIYENTYDDHIKYLITLYQKKLPDPKVNISQLARLYLEMRSDWNNPLLYRMDIIDDLNKDIEAKQNE